MNELLVRLKKKQSRKGYVIIGMSLLISYVIWIGSMWYYGDWYDNGWKYPAKIGSHGAVILMCWSFILSTRFNFVERMFDGLDDVYHAHRHIGEGAFYLILLHPVFLAMDRMPDVMGYLSFFGFSGDWVRNTGLMALIGFVVLIAVSVWIKIRYHVWKQTHHFFGLLFLLIITHGIISGGEIMKYPLLTAWFAVWCGLGLAAYLYIRVLFRWIGPQYEYEVSKLNGREDEVTEVFLKAKGRRMRLKPGQFVYIALDSGEISGEAHPFTISSGPEEEEIRLSIKRSGDWTDRIEKIKEGTSAKVWGPYGRLATELSAHSEKDAVMIGGGIGVTPFLSIIRSDEMKNRTGKVWMIYSVANEEAAVYDEEIAGIIDRKKNAEFIKHLSDDEDFITKDYLAEKVGELKDKLYFICGPAPMMDSLTENLEAAGVPLEQITTEDFNVR